MIQQKNLRKSGKNNFSNFSYYELSDFIPSVNEVFKEIGLLGRFSIEDGKANLQIFNADNRHDQMDFSIPTASVDIKNCTPIQSIGAMNTYLKRYLYMNALELVENDMLDAGVGRDTNGTNANQVAAPRTYVPVPPSRQMAPAVRQMASAGAGNFKR